MAAPFRRADTNADGTLDVSDPIASLRGLFLREASIPCRDAADANDDGVLDIGDPLHTLIHLFVSSIDVPYPGPDFCAEDPTGDSLDCISFPACPPVFVPGAPSVEAVVSPTREGEVELAITTSPLAARVEVAGGASLVVSDSGQAGEYSALVPLVTNRKNRLLVSAVYPDGARSPATTVEVIQDLRAPSLHIDGPEAGRPVFTATTTVFGRVADLLSGFLGLEVDVNGEPAEVVVGIGTNGTFERRNVALEPGANTISVTARDIAGNSVTRQVEIVREVIPDGVTRLEVASGENQEGMALRILDAPIRARVLDGGGVPVTGATVRFEVIRSDGRLGTSSATAQIDGALVLEATTDDDGVGTVFWRLGTDAGCGNNRLRISAPGAAGEYVVCASARPRPASQINIGSGNLQRVEAGSVPPENLRVWVSDGCNGIAGIPVTFRVTQGSGSMGGQNELTVPTSRTGHAEVSFRTDAAGGNNFVQATFDGNPGAPAVFVVYGLPRSPAGQTTFEGVVLDNGRRPLEGARCALIFADGELFQTFSASDGSFSLDLGTRSGSAVLHVVGESVTRAGAEVVPEGTFPALRFDTVVVPRAINSLASPAILPRLDPLNRRNYSTTEDTILEVAGIDGLRMRIHAGSMRLAGGSPAPDGTVVSLNQVHHDDVPMPMPDGASPPFAWTLQPGGATFDPPIEITYPNMSGLPAGAVAYFLSFDHDTSRFEIVASGHVTADGAEIVTDPGVGLTVAGWGCNCPPYSVTANCERCGPTANGCGPQGGILGSLPIFPDCPFTLTEEPEDPDTECTRCFTPACDEHDICYGTCGADKRVCDENMVREAWDQCDCIEDPEEKAQCQRYALVYGDIVEYGGGGAYERGQEIGCECEDRQPGGEGEKRHGAAKGFDPVRDWTDNDRDAAPDDWEEEVGLDPTNPDDAMIDIDEDGLLSITEFFHGTDPFTYDTDGDGFSDGQNVAVVQPQIRALDGSWTVSVGAQFVTVEPDGRFRLPNIAAPDAFGDAGPGSPPDFTSDDYVRVIGVRKTEETTLWAWSAPFRLVSGETFFIDDLQIGLTPPPVPVEIELMAPRAIIAPGESLQLETLGILTDGELEDFTSAVSGTSYRSSNASFATVTRDGLLTAQAEGLVFITAVTEGATSVLRLVISGEQVTEVVVEGTLLLPDGEPAGGATVTSIFGAEVTSDPGGAFSIALSVPAGETPVLRARVEIAGVVYSTTIPIDGDLSSGLVQIGDVTLEAATGLDFDARRDTFVSASVDAVVVADLDLDGRPEAIALPGDVASLAVLPGLEDDTFGPPRFFDLALSASNVAVGRLDDDEIPDVVVHERREQGITVWLGDGAGGLLPPVTSYEDPGPVDQLELVDLDGDDALDLVAVGQINAVVRPGLGDGTFASETFTLPFSFNDAVDFGDIDGDGQVDVVFTQFFSPGIGVVLRTPEGGYDDPVNVPLSIDPEGANDVSLVDIDGDDVLDVLVAHPGGLIWAAGAGDGSFSGGTTLLEGQEVNLVVSGDFDGDGLADIAASEVDPWLLATLRGLGDGTFDTVARLGAPFDVTSLETTDFDGDGATDVVTASGPYVSLFLGGPDGLRGSSSLLPDSFPSDLAAADFDDDGVVDIAVGGETLLDGAAGVRVLLSRDNRTFETSADIPLVGSPSVAASDIDGDEVTDLLTLVLHGSVQVHSGVGDGTFLPAVQMDVPGVLGSQVDAADLNGDGRADLLLLSRFGNEIAVLLALSDGSFDTPVTYATGPMPEELRIADVDRDGNLDVVTVGLLASSITVLPGVGDGTFGTRVDSATLPGAGSVAVGDLTGDGVPDVSVASFNGVAQLLVGEDNGAFLEPIRLATLAQEAPNAVEIADLDGDGFQDLVVAYERNNTVSVFRGTGAIELELPVHFGGPPRQFSDAPVDLKIGDVSGDGKLDVVLAGDLSVVVFYAR